MIAVDTDIDMVDIKRTLEHRLAHVVHRIAVLKRHSCPEELECGGDNTPLSESTDAMQSLEGRTREDEELERLLSRAEILGDALGRVETGSYGICTRCKRWIDPRRLRVLPEAIHCITCEERLERSA